MRNYEIMYIVKASLEEAARQELVTSLHALLTVDCGSVKHVDEWGLREFAYPIDDMTKGYYSVIKVEAEPAAVKEFDRLARINTNVVRFLVLNLDEK